MTTGKRRADELLEDPAVLEALLRDPKKWMKRHRLEESDLDLNDEARSAATRAEKVAAKADELSRLPLVEALPRLRELAEEVWGEDVEVSRVPFGVSLAQRRPVPPPPILDDDPFATTGTGSISCTFRLKCKPDVDR
ncbi:hypothetical protein AB0F81_35790 [Actinoplanes sp. NPDC024001]|uniref:hypothetical protein n=1 Tax=Actinoplanes sp. NPDC024001 TaxID=3154598 RepID=UPI0033ECB5B1